MSQPEVIQRALAKICGGFVVAFHEIPPVRVSQLIDGLQPARPAPLDELVRRAKAGRPTSGLFAVTVDDGVGDNVRALARVFQSREWPATFYLPTQYLDTGEAMAFQWWKRIESQLPRKRLELKTCVLDLSSPDAIARLSRKMEMDWHSRRLETYLPLTMELVDIVARESGTNRAALRPQPPVSWAEVEQMSRSSLLTFESHGVSHAAMSSLRDEELVREMRESRDKVAEHTGRSCRHLAYPFGSPRSIGKAAVAAATRLYDSAATMVLGSLDAANPWLLPRIPLYPENSILFARMKLLLKCTPLCHVWF